MEQAPHLSIGALQPSTAALQPSTGAPQPLAAAPQQSIAALQPLNGAPQPSAAAPQPSTEAPQHSHEAGRQSPEANPSQSRPDLNATEASNQTSNAEIEFASLSVEEMERRLDVDQPVENDVIAYGLYCVYARAKGFSVRRSKCSRFEDGSGIRARDFVCSCEGNKDDKRSRFNIPVSVRPTHRCQCKAKLRVARLKGQNWRVTAFRKDHSHDMYPPDQAHLLRISAPTRSEMELCFEAMVKCGIPMAKAQEFLQTVSSERASVGSSPQIVHDSFSRSSKIEDVDATLLVRHFMDLSNKEAYFYWNFETDINNKVMNIFFRDYQSSVDYECFGDVLSVATTYRTNKYNLLCVPFIGVTNHMQYVMFGCGFMSDETESSYNWLFKAFLESMGGKQPETVFTDQCQAIMNTIGTAFPESYHRLSHRHINLAAQSHFGSLNCDSGFKKLWQKCMTDCLSEEEFELTWKQMVIGYNIEDREWFNLMYRLRKKWATSFSCHRFSAGLDTTLKTKDINVSVKRKLGAATSSLYDCVLGFERVQQAWRMDEKEKDTASHHGRLTIGLNPWLTKAADVYTMEVFSIFQQEVHQSMDFAITAEQVVAGSPLICFSLKARGGNSQIINVQFDRKELSVTCSCHKFEVFGILCCHVLKVFDRVNLEYIPTKYIKKRWTKSVRNKIPDGRSSTSNGANNVSDMAFVNGFMRETHDLVTRAQYHEETRLILTETLEDCKLKLNTWFENAGTGILGANDNSILDEMDDEMH